MDCFVVDTAPSEAPALYSNGQHPTHPPTGEYRRPAAQPDGAAILESPSQAFAPQPIGERQVWQAGAAPVGVEQPLDKPTPAVPRAGARWSLGLGRRFRQLTALTLLALAVWWLVLPLGFPITSQAVVNSRLVQVRAPIDGTAVELLADLGGEISAGAPLARFANPRADTTTLSVLKTRQGELEARKVGLNRELNEVKRAEADCIEQVDRYKSARVSFLRAGLLESSSMALVARHQFENAGKQARRTRLMGRAASGSDQDNAADTESIARTRLTAEEASLAKVKAELAAAQQGVYVRLETPAFVVRADELSLKRSKVTASLKETEHALAVVSGEVGREQRRVDRLAAATASSPVGGVIWKRHGNLGQAARRNEVIYEVADSRTIFVEALLHQRCLRSVKPGSRASIWLTGGQLRVGRVRRVCTTGLQAAEPSFVLQMTTPDMKQARVLIDFEDGPVDQNLIGRHVRVLITDESPSLVERGVCWLFSKMGG